MSFAGNLKTVSFSDILQLVSTGKKTGRLLASHEPQKKELYFNNGNLIYATSSNTEEDMLGNLLVRMGKITKADLQRAINFQQQSGRTRIGAAMLELGLLSKVELGQYLKIQIEEIVYNLFSWKEGEFSFQDGMKPADDQILVNLDTMNLIMEGTRRIDEWIEIRKKLPDYNRMLKPVLQLNLRDQELTLSSDEYQVMMLIGRESTYADIMESSPIGDFPTAKAVFNLINKGLIQPGEATETKQQNRREREDIMGFVAKLYSAAYGAIERVVGRKLGAAKNKVMQDGYQIQKNLYPFISGALRDGYVLDCEFLIKQAAQLPTEARLRRMIQALNSLLVQYLNIVEQVLGEHTVHLAAGEVKKEVSLLLLENSGLAKKYDLENEILMTLKVVEV